MVLVLSLLLLSASLEARDRLNHFIHGQDPLILGRVTGCVEEGVEVLVIQSFKGQYLEDEILLKDVHDLSIGDPILFSLEEDRVPEDIFLVSSADTRKIEILEGPLGDLEMALLEQFIRSDGEDKDFYVRGERGFLRLPYGESVQIYPPLFERGENIFWVDSGQGEKRILKKMEGEEMVLAKENPSQPIISPRGDRLAFMEPFLWEVRGEVFLYEGEEKELLLSREDLPREEKPKAIYWLDNKRLLLIIGYAYGTVSVGGDLYSLDIEKGDLLPIYQLEPEKEVKDLKIEGQDLLLTIASFCQDYLEYDLDEKRIPLSSLFNKEGL